MMSTLEFRPLSAVGFGGRPKTSKTDYKVTMKGGDILELHPLSISMVDFTLSSPRPSTVL